MQEPVDRNEQVLDVLRTAQQAPAAPDRLLTVTQIMNATGLPVDAVRTAVRQLLAAGLIRREINAPGRVNRYGMPVGA